MTVTLQLFFLLLLQTALCEGFSCKNQNNNDVDWWAVYKIPELHVNHGFISSIQSGYGFFYLDVETPSNWTTSNTRIDSDGQAVSNTLQQVYSNRLRNDVFILMYNDETPSGSKSSYKGHAKGVLLFDNNQGFWLIHSVPKFPSSKEYSYPDNGRHYGQSLLCITFPYTELNQIGTQLLYYQPYIYFSSLPAEMAQHNVHLSKVVAGQTIYRPPWFRQYTLTSAAGNNFVSFAKQKNYGKDIYYNLIAPSLEVSLVAETWQNGPGDFQSWCQGQYFVKNVEDIGLPNDINFQNSHDHSKWAIASGANVKPYVCVGGVNRQHGQLDRGGGMMCFLNKQVWSVYRNSVMAVQGCRIQE